MKNNFTRSHTSHMLCEEFPSNQGLICYVSNSPNNQGPTKLSDYSLYIAKMNLLLSVTATFFNRQKQLSDTIISATAIL